MRPRTGALLARLLSPPRWHHRRNLSPPIFLPHIFLPFQDARLSAHCSRQPPYRNKKPEWGQACSSAIVHHPLFLPSIFLPLIFSPLFPFFGYHRKITYRFLRLAEKRKRKRKKVIDLFLLFRHNLQQRASRGSPSMARVDSDHPTLSFSPPVGKPRKNVPRDAKEEGSNPCAGRWGKH